jgi:hypothetical protein
MRLLPHQFGPPPQCRQMKATVKDTTPTAVLRNTECKTSGLARSPMTTRQGRRGQAPPCRDQAMLPQYGHMRSPSLEIGPNPLHPARSARQERQRIRHEPCNPFHKRCDHRGELARQESKAAWAEAQREPSCNRHINP